MSLNYLNHEAFVGTGYLVQLMFVVLSTTNNSLVYCTKYTQAFCDKNNVYIIFSLHEANTYKTQKLISNAVNEVYFLWTEYCSFHMIIHR